MAIYILILKGRYVTITKYKRIRIGQYCCSSIFHICISYYVFGQHIFIFYTISLVAQNFDFFQRRFWHLTQHDIFAYNLARSTCADSFRYGRTANAQNRRRARTCPLVYTHNTIVIFYGLTLPLTPPKNTVRRAVVYRPDPFTASGYRSTITHNNTRVLYTIIILLFGDRHVPRAYTLYILYYT